MYQFTSGTRTALVPVTDESLRTKEHLSQGSHGISSTTMVTQPKRLTVKTLRNTLAVDPQRYYEAVWEKLTTTMAAIFADEKPVHSNEALYNEIMILCRQRCGSRLYKDLQMRLGDHIDGKVQASIESISTTTNPLGLLKHVLFEWHRWNAQLSVVKTIFYFLDRSYILQHGLESVLQIGISKFRSTLQSTDSIIPTLLEAIFELVLHVRQGTECESPLIADAVKMMQSLQIYDSLVEPQLLVSSKLYYESWADQACASLGLSDYISMCETFSHNERRRAIEWALPGNTQQALKLSLEKIIILGKRSRLLDPVEVSGLLENDQFEILSKLYKLLDRQGAGDELQLPLREFLRTNGLSIVLDTTHEHQMVRRLLIMKQKMDFIWTAIFRSSPEVRQNIRSAFEEFMNASDCSKSTWGTDNLKPGEMIAKHVDAILKGEMDNIQEYSSSSPDVLIADDPQQSTSNDMEDVQIMKQLDQALDLFRFVHGKAVFEAFYKRDLARRLLLGRSASADAEKSMLVRLKTECGAGFTHNLEQMFKDVELAREEQSAYRAITREKRLDYGFDLGVNVLSASAWPSYQDPNINMPEHILKTTQAYEQFYKQKHIGRRLVWKHALAHSLLLARFSKANKELVVSAFQAIVLLCFNQADTLSYSELKAITGFEESELQRTLQSLACAKYRVLTKSPRGREVGSSDNFAFNNGFHHPKYRIKINQIQARESKQENQQTHHRIAADRAFETQAAIVRIMKSQKSITLPQLVAEVIMATKTRGPLDPAEIKKNIDKLIDKDYIERDAESHNTYIYVA